MWRTVFFYKYSLRICFFQLLGHFSIFFLLTNTPNKLVRRVEQFISSVHYIKYLAYEDAEIAHSHLLNTGCAGLYDHR